MTKAEVIALIESSEALRQNNREKEYWLDLVEDMDEIGLNRLGRILKEEAETRAVILDKMETKLAKVDAEHVAELKTFTKQELPKFVKSWEASSRAKENPEDIFNQVQL